MALTVETGSGLANADAFDSIENVDAYHLALGNSTWTGTDALKEAAIRRATAFLSNSFAWQGYRVKGRAQALAWPRYDVWDRSDRRFPLIVPHDAVPQEIKDATAEIALRELVTPGSMNPDVVLSDKVKREKVGPLEVEYANVQNDAGASRPVLLIVRDMIGHLIDSEFGNALAGRAERV